MEHFDAVIIGSGQGGTPLSKKLAKAGWKTALVEKELIGGTCINYGCTPTKTMISSAKAAYTVAQAGKHGVEVNDYKVNIATILSRKEEVVESFRGSSREGLEETENLSLLFGEASFTSPKELKIKLREGGTKNITADKIFIDVGTRPTIPDTEGLKEVGYLTSTTLLELTQIPKHLFIIGGGYIGLEFGQMYRRFGSRVTILHHGSHVLSREDEDIAATVEEFLQEEEIAVYTGAEAVKAEKKDGEILVTMKTKKEEKVISCSHVLVAAGTTPNTDSLNLKAAGVEVDEKGYVEVNDKLETNVEGVYALGDVKGGPEFTHISYNDHLVLYNNLVNGKSESIQGRMVPYCMFTDPQLGRVGLSEAQARKKGLNIKVAAMPMAQVARAIETGDTRGLMKAVVDAKSGKILGVAVIGQEGGEIMSVLQMAMVGGIGYKQIREMIFAHPLYAESLNNLFMQLVEDE